MAKVPRSEHAAHREIFFKTGYFSTLAILGLKGVTGNSFQSCAADDCTICSAALKTVACQLFEGAASMHHLKRSSESRQAAVHL